MREHSWLVAALSALLATSAFAHTPASERHAQYVRDNPAPIAPIPMSEFVHQRSGLDISDVGNVVTFEDNVTLRVNDVTDGVRIITMNRHEVEVVLGRRADYYHFLGTDLVHAVWHDSSHPRRDTIFEATGSDDYDRVKELLAKRPELANAQENGTDKPVLIDAVEGGNVQLIQLFLDHGAKTNLEDNHGQTTLQYVLKGQQAKSEGAIVTLLLQYGANVDQQDKLGNSALSIARQNHLTQYIPLLMRHHHSSEAKPRASQG